MFEDKQLKDLLKKNIEVSEESLSILKKMHRAAVTARVFWVLKWLIIIGASIGAYYYLEPYLQNFIKTLNSINTGLGEIKQTTDNNFLEKIKNLLPR